MAATHYGFMNPPLAGNNPASGTWTLPTAPGGGWTDRYLGIFWLYARAGIFDPGTPANITTKISNNGAGYGRLYIGYRYLSSGDTTFGWTRVTGSSNADVIYGVHVVDLGATGGSGDPFSDAVLATFDNLATGFNPPGVTPTVADSFIFTIFGKNNDFTGTPTAPAGYTLAGSLQSVAGTDAGAAVAYRNLTGGAGALEDPGAWTTAGGAATDDGTMWTAAISPVGGAAVDVNTAVPVQTITASVQTATPTGAANYDVSLQVASLAVLAVDAKTGVDIAVPLQLVTGVQTVTSVETASGDVNINVPLLTMSAASQATGISGAANVDVAVQQITGSILAVTAAGVSNVDVLVPVQNLTAAQLASAIASGVSHSVPLMALGASVSPVAAVTGVGHDVPLLQLLVAVQPVTVAAETPGVNVNVSLFRMELIQNNGQPMTMYLVRIHSGGASVVREQYRVPLG